MTATNEDKQLVKDCITFYEWRGWDWSVVVEFLIRKANGSLPSSRRESK